MRTHKTTAALLAAAALILTGCAGDPVPAASPTASAEHDHDHGDHDVLVPSPTTTPDLDAAATAAVDALEAYADRDLDYAAWFDQLKPHLHPTAVEAYGTVNPSRLPVVEIQDGAEAAATSTDTYAVV